MRPHRSLRELRGANEGVSAIEFALVGTILAILCIGLVDVGMGIWKQMEVGNAARAGADFAATKGWYSDKIKAAVTNATSLSGVAASPAPSTFYGCPSGGSLVAVSAGTICTDGKEAGEYAKVNAQATYTPILPYPGIPNPMTLSATSIARLY